jgi:hypothetical protein
MIRLPFRESFWDVKKRKREGSGGVVKGRKARDTEFVSDSTENE